MVGSIVLGVCIVVASIILGFKGININYKKHMIAEDKRLQMPMEPEKKPEDKAEPSKEPNSSGPMDSVITTIQDLFGPGHSDENNKN